MTYPLLSEWAAWLPADPPYVFPGDEDVVNRLSRKGLTCSYTSWADYYACDEFGRTSDRRLHLGLLPQPFCGDPLTAQVVILMLNPGLGPNDVFGELNQAEFRAALLANLRREPVRGGGLIYLDPHFGWHDGFKYWHGKLRGIISALAAHFGTPYSAARDRLKAATATLELLPYHSASAGISESVIGQMRSAQLALQFVRDVLVRKARAGDCLVLVTRKGRLWGLTDETGVVVYSNSEARAAHLSPKSRGGAQLLEFAAKKIFA